MPQLGKKTDPSKAYSLLALTGTFTFFLVSPILISIFLGLLFDNFFRTTPLFIIIGAIMGFIVGMVNILFFLNKLSKN